MQLFSIPATIRNFVRGEQALFFGSYQADLCIKKQLPVWGNRRVSSRPSLSFTRSQLVVQLTCSDLLLTTDVNLHLPSLDYFNASLVVLIGHIKGSLNPLSKSDPLLAFLLFFQFPLLSWTSSSINRLWWILSSGLSSSKDSLGSGACSTLELLMELLNNFHLLLGSLREHGIIIMRIKRSCGADNVCVICKSLWSKVAPRGHRRQTWRAQLGREDSQGLCIWWRRRVQCLLHDLVIK